MGYLYENTSPERFQHFCQSLMMSDYPNLQCLPVGQPDGGRDGWDAESRTVLQVKFKRADEEENADWMIATLEEELPKIVRLAERGAKNYVMTTSARGTAHLDTGRIDRVQKWLDDHLPIPAICLWRDDLDRRFDGASVSLKLKYAELLSLDDGIEAALFAVLGREDDRNQRAIAAFLATQFEADKTVKFKQVSLSNDLLDLFIDIPVGFPMDRGRLTKRWAERMEGLFDSLGASRAFSFHHDGLGANVFLKSEDGTFQRASLGAAELLLSDAAQENLRLVVLEGAPGQGKSTLAQYVCQMHRARYLKRNSILDRVPERHTQTAFRVPIKIDLRDYASFLDGNSAFARPTSGTATQPRTLEVFLAELISYGSGGLEYTVYDVSRLVENVPVLLFLDGLDEVADLELRERLIASIGEALVRWGELSANLQLVVTSRPSVFGSGPGFDKLGFETINLLKINSDGIDEYTRKWTAARNLDEGEALDVKKVLDEKLELAHIRDLTRNPMQLTILLSLIHQIGHSLPDQRTDLYTRYVDLFLTREADKSAVVRDNRPMLMGFIQHLAWVLQTQAESSKSAGSISSEGLQDLAREFLRAEGGPEEIADDLFGGGLERIFVLVERIEGLYEFEVQPLREYFCARYLYSTAPVGTYRTTELRGDRAQRFEALAANPLWLNVCRFYAGSCERGETGTLVFSLEEMIRTGDIASSMHARRVGLALLQDWVFSGSKYAQKQLIEAVFDEVGTQILIGDSSNVDDLRLDVDCGRDTLRDKLFEGLEPSPVEVRTSSLCYVIRINGGRHLGQRFCNSLIGKAGDERTRQLIRMFRSGGALDLAPDLVWDLIREDEPNRHDLLRRCSALIAWSEDVAVSIEPLVDEFVSGVLDGQVVDFGSSLSPLSVFSEIMVDLSLFYLRGTRVGVFDRSDRGDGNHKGIVDLTPNRVTGFVDDVLQMQYDPGDFIFDRHKSIGVLSLIIERARTTFGETWSTISLAVRAAGIRASVSLPDGADRMFDTTVPLFARARSARLRRGGPRWWQEQLALATSDLDRMMWAGLVLMWSSVDNLYALAHDTNAIVDGLSDEQYMALTTTLAFAGNGQELRSDRKRLSPIDLSPFSNRSSVLVAAAFNAPASDLRYLSEHEGDDPFAEFLTIRRLEDEISDPPSWRDGESILTWAKRVKALTRLGHAVPSEARRHMTAIRPRMELARVILRDSDDYPGEFVAHAAAAIQSRYRPRPLSAIAVEQDWSFG